ncbi:type I restriction-modification system subunit M N-terminal domain-containing protein [Acidiferrimicrobium sp. IK]|uniref:hypothetical protein n=1 Tax=Acidiferrimicrobium sp. IK TaxID=2871700 RepID=UPI0039673302|nr:type I restriction-modification system subunit M N-terminal domain-containing protein [Acidiferrimicrobium sp. IK]
MTILRRLDCVLGPTKTDVLARAKEVPNLDQLDFVVRRELGLPFHNTSTFDLAKLLDDPDNSVAKLVHLDTPRPGQPVGRQGSAGGSARLVQGLD